MIIFSTTLFKGFRNLGLQLKVILTITIFFVNDMRQVEIMPIVLVNLSDNTL